MTFWCNIVRYVHFNVSRSDGSPGALEQLLFASKMPFLTPQLTHYSDRHLCEMNPDCLGKSPSISITTQTDKENAPENGQSSGQEKRTVMEAPMFIICYLTKILAHQNFQICTLLSENKQERCNYLYVFYLRLIKWFSAVTQGQFT